MKRIVAVFFALLLLSVPTLRVSALSNVYMKNENAVKKVALTFDDGPHPIYTPRILDILEKYGVKATFFVIGQNVENYPEAFEALSKSENEIGNHTYDHKNVGRMSEERVREEITKTEQAIKEHSGRHSFLLRPPEGSLGDPLRRVSVEAGYDIILWSIDTLDWAHTPSQKIARDVLSSVGDGDIILMHDYVSHGSTTCDALEIMIPKMLEMGYEFVTVTELICEE